jgi:hypothetical protein
MAIDQRGAARSNRSYSGKILPLLLTFLKPRKVEEVRAPNSLYLIGGSSAKRGNLANKSYASSEMGNQSEITGSAPENSKDFNSAYQKVSLSLPDS